MILKFIVGIGIIFLLKHNPSSADVDVPDIKPAEDSLSDTLDTIPFDSVYEDKPQSLLDSEISINQVSNENKLSDEQSSSNETIDTDISQAIDSKGNTSEVRFNCTPVFRDESNQTSQVILVNSTTLPNYLQFKTTFSLDLSWSTSSIMNHSVSEPGECTLLIFYLDWCPFSASAAPHFNAMGRLFPQFNVLAIDATNIYSLTMRFGVVGVPSMFLFHNSKIVSRYNHSEANIEHFADYIKTLSSFEPIEMINVTESDYTGPLVIHEKRRSSFLFISSWIFCLIFFAYYFVQSELFRKLKDQVYNLWNEAQFHHEHIE